MFKAFLSGSSLFCLLVSFPAFALDFTGSAYLDLSTLRISGIGYNLLPFFQYQQAFVAASFPATSPVVNNTIDDRSGWADRSVTADLAGYGAAVTTANSSLLFASGSLVGSGGMNSQVWRRGIITANEAGNLTVSVRYVMINSGVPNPVPRGMGFSTAAALNLGELSNIRYSPDSKTALESGILSLTRWFTQGEFTALDLAAEVTAAVPEPNTLWSILIGMVGMALLPERLRHNCSSGKKS